MKQVTRKLVLMLMMVFTAALTAHAYDITIVTPQNGKLATSKSTANAGEKITVTATPDEGYGVDEITVVQFADGGEASSRQQRAPQIAPTVNVTKVSDTQYSFTMPEGGVEVSATFKSIPQIDISSATVTLSATTFTYNGASQAPTVSSVKLGNQTLVENKDYAIAKLPQGVNVGSYMVVISGKGTYKNTVSTQFTIEPRQLTENMMTLSATAFTYNGQIQKPTVTLTDMVGGVNLLTTDNYDVTIPESRNKGDFSVIAMGKGNYTGVVSKVYTINTGMASDFVVTLEKTNYVYDGTAFRPAVTVKHNNRTLTEGASADYTLIYTNNVNAGTANIVVTGQNNYAGQHEKTFTITPRQLVDTYVQIDKAAFTYNGEILRPEVTVKDGTLLTENDYTVTLPASKNAGAYELTVTGKNNYSGTVKKQYAIGEMDITGATVTLNELANNTYDGTEKKPTVLDVTKDGQSIPRSSYDVVYANNINKGEATVTVTAKGNYKGTASAVFMIAAKPVVSSMISLSANKFTFTGKMQRPDVTVTDGDMTMTAETDYTLTNEGGVDVGTYQVSIVGKGNYTGTVSVDYEISGKAISNLTATVITEDIIYDGKAKTPEVTLSDGNLILVQNSDYTVEYSNNVNAGDAALCTFTGKGNYSGTLTKSFVIAPKVLTDDMLMLSRETFGYNGEEQMPVVTVKDGNTKLVQDVDYTEPTGAGKNAGIYTVTVTGLGNYTGEIKNSYEITAKSVDASMISLSEENLVFNGSVQRPEVVVKDDKNVLTMDADYTLMNDGATDVGNYKVIIEGKGNYTGKAERQYSIVPKDATKFIVALSEETMVYTGDELMPKVTVKDGNTTLDDNQYEVSYSNNRNVGTAVVTVTGKENYNGTLSTTFTITPRLLTKEMVMLSTTELVYNGHQQKPAVTVADGEAMTDNDYNVTNEGGINVGEYQVVVKGRGNYTGEVTFDYNINQLDLQAASLVLNTLYSYQYDGTAKEPTVRELSFGDLMVPMASYEVSYSDNVNVGEATVTLTGKGNYTGEVSATFEITPKPLERTMVTLSNTTFTYNSKLQKPEVSVADGELMTKADYVIENDGGTNVGEYDVVVRAQGNYLGEETFSFTILSLGIETAQITYAEELNYVYDGTEKDPAISKVTIDEVEVPIDLCEVIYTNNVHAGKAVVTIKGNGNFLGEVTDTFIIAPKMMTDEMVMIAENQYVYSAQLQKPEVSVADGELMTEADYTVENEGGTNAGTYSVVVRGQNDYAGEVVLNYTIEALSISDATVTFEQLQNIIYDGQPKEPAVSEAYVGELQLTDADYDLIYENNINAGMAVVKLIGKGNYTDQFVDSFAIARMTLVDSMLVLSNTEFIYNGEIQVPVASVVCGDMMLVEETDYHLVNQGGSEAGTYQVSVEGQGNFDGLLTREWHILPQKLDSLYVSLLLDETPRYDGTAHEPQVVVSKTAPEEEEMAELLLKDTDYVVSYEDNVNAGTGKVTVTGVGNYDGEHVMYFTIAPRQLTESMVSLNDTLFVYNGRKQMPVVEVNDNELITKDDYVIGSEFSMNAGSYTLTINGSRNYTGVLTYTYHISKAPVKSVEIFDVYSPATAEVLSNYSDFYAEGVEDMSTLTWFPADTIAAPNTVYTATWMLTADENHYFSYATTVYVGYSMATSVVVNDTKDMLTVRYSFEPTHEQWIVPTVAQLDTVQAEGAVDLLVTILSEEDKWVRIEKVLMEDSLDTMPMGVQIPDSIFLTGQEAYEVTEINSGAFEGCHNITDIYLPDTEWPILIQERALRLYSDTDSIKPVATLHMPLALFDDYALMDELAENYEQGKMKTVVKAKNKYWTFSCGVDVLMPADAKAYTVRSYGSDKVEIVELTPEELSMDSVQVIKAGNGILFSGKSTGGEYEINVYPKRMKSGSDEIVDDQKDYGMDNLLIPIVKPTRFFSPGIFLLSNNAFYAIDTNSENYVGACKAVLSMPEYERARKLTIVVNETTGVEAVEQLMGDSQTQWFDMSGKRISKPVGKGLYIMRNADGEARKVEIR